MPRWDPCHSWRCPCLTPGMDSHGLPWCCVCATLKVCEQLRVRDSSFLIEWVPSDSVTTEWVMRSSHNAASGRNAFRRSDMAGTAGSRRGILAAVSAAGGAFVAATAPGFCEFNLQPSFS